MTWEEYYENFYDWEESTQVRKLSSVTLDGTVDPSEVIEVIESFFEDRAVVLLMKKAAAAHVPFRADQIMELSEYDDEEGLRAVLRASRCKFTDEQLEELYDLTGDAFLLSIAKRQGSSVLSEWDDGDRIEESEKGSFFTEMGIFDLLFSGAGGRENSASKFRVGDHVFVRTRGQEGNIIDINGDLYMVSFENGGIVDSYPASELERIR